MTLSLKTAKNILKFEELVLVHLIILTELVCSVVGNCSCSSWLLISDELYYCSRLDDRAVKRGGLECIPSGASTLCSNPFLHHQSGVGQSPTEHQHLHLLHAREVRVPQVPRILQQPAILPRRHWFHRHGGLWEEMLAAESKGRNRIKFKLVFFRWTARPHMLK